jgi:hypothetical protein
MFRSNVSPPSSESKREPNKKQAEAGGKTMLSAVTAPTVQGTTPLFASDSKARDDFCFASQTSVQQEARGSVVG